MPCSRVTNSAVGLSATSAALRRRSSSAGPPAEGARWRISVRTAIMNSAAGMPLPDTSPRKKASRPSGRGKKSYRSPDTSRAGWTRANSSGSPSANTAKSAGKNDCWMSRANRNSWRSRSSRSRSDVQAGVLQDRRHLDGDGGQHFEVVGMEGMAGPQAVELDHPQPPVLPAQQRHAQKRTQVQRNHRGRQHEVRIAAHVLAEQADALLQGTADDGPAVGIIVRAARPGAGCAGRGPASGRPRRAGPCRGRPGGTGAADVRASRPSSGSMSSVRPRCWAISRTTCSLYAGFWLNSVWLEGAALTRARMIWSGSGGLLGVAAGRRCRSRT